MDTTLQHNEPVKAKRKKKPLYGNAPWYFGFGLLIILAGFYNSFLLKFGATDNKHQFHGLAALLWMLMLIVQPILTTKTKLKWHRILGKVSFVLVPFVVLSVCMMEQTMIASKASYPPNSVYQLSFVDAFSVIQFLYFYVMAIVTRRKIQEHARYMAATAFIFIIPGLGRLLFLIPVINTFNITLNVSYALVELVLLVLIWDDHRSGKIRKPYVIALALFAIQHVLLNFIVGFAPWERLMDHYAAISIFH
ncbi:hypothetical protein KXD93_24600 [Mucilaginibacter sp. BJC16-A38]|uniref:hypothetical protein n=1 Tax=Mucilaginibacter phenanthrenivorans TaxID=1234842 RepID=UPI00215717D8|nr:hypothetical protein [Mucilaginibacter phenanthrenivorans]MCR8560860.1 hypothetical protein [Mucilaginibacter phenanthrenivorans]